MKQFDFLKKSLVAASLVCAAGSVNAQVHPLAFGTTIGTTYYSNFYKDYVGLRFQVVSPAPVAGDKNYTTSNDGDPANTGNWGGLVPPLLIDKEIIMPQPGDSLVGSPITVSMAGKIGFVYRGATEFGAKALACQNAGALACIIVNNISGGPVGMGAGAVGASVTIPVYMVSKDDGDAMDIYYHVTPVPHVTITNWGQNYAKDLGFVPGGLAGWHAFAVPANQLTSSPFPYRNIDGAFIANFGSTPATNVKVASDLKFNGTSIHTSTTGNLANFTVADSIYAMFMNTDYSFPASPGVGRYDLTYTIQADGTDDYPYDNTITQSFYASDSVFSKSRYDFANNAPIRTTYRAYGTAQEFIWGPMYYVNNGGTAISNVQFALAMNAATPGVTPILGGEASILVFKWVDGDTSEDGTVFPKDSIIENGELKLVSLGIYNFDGINDTSGALLQVRSMGDTDGVAKNIELEANSWYFIGVDLNHTAGQLFLGCDGQLSPYPRVYGRYHLGTDSMLDYNNIIAFGNKDAIYADALQGYAPHTGTASNFINTVDSFVFSESKGLVPSVAVVTKTYVPDAVNTVTKPIAEVNIFPNPSNDYINVTVGLEKPAKSISYEVVDGMARFVGRETHTNVQNDKNVIDVRTYAAGTYYMIITIDGKKMARKFTIVK